MMVIDRINVMIKMAMVIIVFTVAVARQCMITACVYILFDGCLFRTPSFLKKWQHCARRSPEMREIR